MKQLTLIIFMFLSLQEAFSAACDPTLLSCREKDEGQLYQFSQKILSIMTKVGITANPLLMCSVSAYKTYSEVKALGEGLKAAMKDVKNATGFGHGMDAAVFAGVGAEINFEIIYHDKKAGLFCAPGLQLQTDVGFAVQGNLIKTFGCKSNTHFSGDFLSLGASVSFEALSAPITLTSAYSVGLHYKEFKKSVLPLLKEKELRSELKFLFEVMQKEEMFEDNLDLKYLMVLLSKEQDQKLLGTYTVNFNNDAKEMNQLLKTKKSMKKMRPFFEVVEDFKRKLEQHPMKSKFGKTVNILQRLDSVLTKCDSLTMDGGVGLSLFPAAISVSHTNSHLLVEFDQDEQAAIINFLDSPIKECRNPPKELKPVLQKLKTLVKNLRKCKELTPS